MIVGLNPVCYECLNFYGVYDNIPSNERLQVTKKAFDRNIHAKKLLEVELAQVPLDTNQVRRLHQEITQTASSAFFYRYYTEVGIV